MEYLVNYSWVILVVVMGVVILWSMGIFQTQVVPVAKGFMSIRPELAGLSLNSKGNFTGTFGNKAGAKIIINSIVIENQLARRNCSITTTLPLTAGSAEFFKINANSCGSQAAGAHYTLNVQMNYNITVGETTTTHTETGTIEGQYV
jgi:hypothetical protein